VWYVFWFCFPSPSPPLPAASPTSLAAIHSEFSSFHDVVVVLCTREGLRSPVCLCLDLREREFGVGHR
jgi:hypothetical protein